MAVFDLLKQMVAGAEKNKEACIAELEKRKANIDAEIADIQAGVVKVMDDTALKDRFLLVGGTARELLGDFRTVEQKFRELDRLVRERVSIWEGCKGELLEQIFGERDAIAGRHCRPVIGSKVPITAGPLYAY